MGWGGWSGVIVGRDGGGRRGGGGGRRREVGRWGGFGCCDFINFLGRG